MRASLKSQPGCIQKHILLLYHIVVEKQYVAKEERTKLTVLVKE